MRTARWLWVGLLIAVTGSAAHAGGEGQALTMRPHLFLTAEPVEGLASVAQFRRAVRREPLKSAWQKQLAIARRQVEMPPFTVDTEAPWRPQRHVETRNRDYPLVSHTVRRMERAALAFLVTGEKPFRDSVLAQFKALFDEHHWPNWMDRAHNGKAENPIATLRTGMLLGGMGVAYDWIHPSLSAEQREWIVEGMARRGFGPFWRAIEEDVWWLDRQHNFKTVILGGAAIGAMGLGPEYERSEELIELADREMEEYTGGFGPAGEWNEGVGYAGALGRAVDYFLARYYHSGGQYQRMGEPPFPQAAEWLAHMTLPPGRLAAMGDADLNQAINPVIWAAVADVNGNGVFQTLCLDHLADHPDPKNLTYVNPAVEPTPVGERLPTFRAYSAHGGVVASRVDWNPRSTPSVVYGNVGRPTVHGHNDIGQVAIDGHGRRLLVDLGRPKPYPPDYSSKKNRWKYYPANATGHNVLTIAGRRMRPTRGRFLKTGHDPQRGAWWQMDVTDVYKGAERITRTVAHLHPRYVAVVDQVRLKRPEPIALRWHTITEPTLNDEGRFRAATDGVALAGRVASLGERKPALSVRRHAYEPPHDMGRLNSPLKQRNEPYVHVAVKGQRCRLVTLFVVQGPDDPEGAWRRAGENAWRVPNGPRCTVTADAIRLQPEGQTPWTIPLPAP